MIIDEAQIVRVDTVVSWRQRNFTTLVRTQVRCIGGWHFPTNICTEPRVSRRFGQLLVTITLVVDDVRIIWTIIGHCVRNPCCPGHTVTIVEQTTGCETTRTSFLARNICSAIVGVDGAEYDVHFFKGVTLRFGD